MSGSRPCNSHNPKGKHETAKEYPLSIPWYNGEIQEMGVPRKQEKTKQGSDRMSVVSFGQLVGNVDPILRRRSIHLKLKMDGSNAYFVMSVLDMSHRVGRLGSMQGGGGEV